MGEKPNPKSVPVAGLDVAFPITVGPHTYGLWLRPGPFTDTAGNPAGFKVDHASRTITVDLNAVRQLHLLPLFAGAAVADAWSHVTKGGDHA